MTAATRKRYVYIVAAGVILGLLLLHRRRAGAQADNHTATAASVIPGGGQGDTSGSATGSSTPAPTNLWGYQWAQAINGTGHSLYTAGVDDTASMSTATRPDGAAGLRRYVPPGSTLPPATYGPRGAY
jgi:hypothetical protein